MQPQNSSRQIKLTRSKSGLRETTGIRPRQKHSIDPWNQRIDPFSQHSPQYAGNPVPLHGCGDACGFEAPRKTP
jgi:hypothetical protein